MIPENYAIEIRNLTKIYRNSRKPAIDNVNLNIKKGHFFGLLGPNGAGKTTMIRILCGLLSASKGEAFINGYSVKNELNNIRKIVGVVPQDIALYPSLTARENLSVYGGICGLKGRTLTQRIEELLFLFGLEKSQNIQVNRYSGGMKRRLNLIAGLLHSPAVLFLDEPTVGIDVQSKNVIIGNLKEINSTGTTIIYTSHYLEEAENLCSYMAIIDEGHIIIHGTLAEIRQSNDSCNTLEDIYLALTGKTVRD